VVIVYQHIFTKILLSYFQISERFYTFTKSTKSLDRMSQYLAEFVGTMILMIFGSGVVAGAVLKRSKSENGGWLLICTA